MKAFVFLTFTIIGILLMLGAWWLSGFNFDHRGEKAVLCYIMSGTFGLLLGFGAACYYGDQIEKK